METTLHKHIGTHRNIIEFYDTGDDPTWMWIAMELADGGDLFDKIEADSGVSDNIAHVYFTQLVNAVSYMHSKGVGHRDIKPENILLSSDGDLKLADFGMATLFEYNGKRKMAVTLCGSPPYVAPEVISCSAHNGVKGEGYAADQADVWSCGVVLFVLLAGNTPWNKPVEGRDEYGRLNEFSEYVKSNGRPEDELWQGLPADVLSLIRGMMRIDVKTRFSLEDVRRHPWFTRPNKYLGPTGRLVNGVDLATTMFESLKVSFDTDPLRGTQLFQDGDLMEIDRPMALAAGYSASQPDTPAGDMVFDWEKPRQLLPSATQPLGGKIGMPATQQANASVWLSEEPSMSQFAATPSVPLSRTQMARKFRDILPSHGLTKFYSIWALNLLVPLITEALSRLGIPTPSMPKLSAHDYESVIKVKTLDSRACPLTGTISIEIIAEGLIEVSFIKASGDPLEWRRLFKKVAVLSKDAVYKPDE